MPTEKYNKIKHTSTELMKMLNNENISRNTKSDSQFDFVRGLVADHEWLRYHHEHHSSPQCREKRTLKKKTKKNTTNEIIFFTILAGNANYLFRQSLKAFMVL